MAAYNDSRNVTLRPSTPDDEALLYALYCSTRAEELAAFGWDEAQQQSFLRMQFDARQRQYGFQYAGASDDIVLLDNKAIGRLLISRGSDEIRLVDIALLPECRNSGIGSRLIRELLDEAERADKSVTLHVEKTN